MPYRDQNGDWRGVVKINGVRVAQKRFKLKRDAESWEREERDRILGRQKSGITFSEFSSKYLELAEKRFGKKTYDEKISLARNFLLFLGNDLILSEISSGKISDYLLEQTNRRSTNAANKDRKNLLAMWNWGVRIMDLPSNPVSKTDKFPHEVTKPYVPPEKDILKVLAVASGVDRVFLECYLQTGARRSEIFKLTWDDVNFDKRTVTLKTRKTKDGSVKTRTLDMKGNDSFWTLMEWWWKNRTFKDLPFVFVDDHPGPHYGKPYLVRRRFLKSLCEKAGVKRFTFHPVRHFVASILADKHKISTPTIQKILGHERLSTTDGYVQRISSDVGEAIGKLGERGEETKRGISELSTPKVPQKVY